MTIRVLGAEFVSGLVKDKSLIRRHREDDLDFLRPENLFTIDAECVPNSKGLAGDELGDGFNTRAKQLIGDGTPIKWAVRIVIGTIYLTLDYCDPQN